MKARTAPRQVLAVLLLVFACRSGREPPMSASEVTPLLANAAAASEALQRCHRYLHAWLALADPRSGLIPTNLGRGRDVWQAANSAADNYPFLVLSAALTDRAAFDGPLRAMLATERRLTARVGPLPDDYAFATAGFVHESIDMKRLLFGASEYVKDGLLPLTEWLGASPWRDRMLELLDAIWQHADVATTSGLVPTDDIEVHGEMLQVLSRLYWLTHDPRHLEWAIRLGDHYLLSDAHPTRANRFLRLRDHGCEVVSGLSELYATLHFARPAKQEQYRAPLHEMLDRILEVGRNADGLFVDMVHPRTGETRQLARGSGNASDSFGYTLNGYYTVYLVDGTERYRDAVRHALAALSDGYRSFRWEGESADGYADAIEGALNLHNREPMPGTARWIDSEIRVMWAKQRPDGIIEGWHGDGNFARTTIMYALWKTQGVIAEPWREDVALGATRTGDGVRIAVSTREPWTGHLVFDTPRHKTHLGLPLDWPRINQFPEWFTVDAERSYVVEDSRERRTLPGRSLLTGLPLALSAGEREFLLVSPAPHRAQ